MIIIILELAQLFILVLIALMLWGIGDKLYK
nr:hypothetical protein [uncultured Mediterranean phage uvMED]